MEACDKCQLDGGTVDKVAGEIRMKNRANMKGCLNFPLLSAVVYIGEKMHCALFKLLQTKRK